jgi:type I restriction enzyme S subunit
MKQVKKPLEEVAEFCLGKMLDQKKNKGDLRPYLANINVRWGEFDFYNLREMRFEQHEIDRFGLRHGDIVMCEGGEPGRCAIWKNQVPGMMIQKALHRIRPHSCLDYRFVYYTFLHFGQTGQFESLFTGATIRHLPREKLALLELNIPPISTQRKIAGILSAYDDLIENNARRIAILEAMTQAIYREWFVEFRFPGHEKVKLVDSPLGKSPEGWKLVKVDDAIFINPRTTVPKEGEKPFVSMGAVPHNTMLIDVAATEMRAGNSGSKFQNDDTLFARITPCLENGKTAFVQFLSNPDAVAFGSTEFIVLRSKTVCPEFVYLLARSDAFRDNAIKSMSGATGRQRVQEKCFDNFFFAHPDPKSLSAFAEFMRPLFKNVFALSKKNANLRKTRDLLLPKLISGQLDVEDLAIETYEAITE